MDQFLTGFWQAASALLPQLLIAVLFLVLSFYLARLLTNLLKRVLVKRHATFEIIQLLTQITYWSIVAFGIISALQRFVDVTAFLAGLGILGFTIGFALQNIMQNFVAGIILLIQRPFHTGDLVTVAGFDGTVLSVELRTTEMRTTDGRMVMIPNATILSNPIINYSRAAVRRIELPLKISKNADLESARGIILQAVREVPGFVEDPAPIVAFHTLGDTSVDLTVFFWADMQKTNPVDAKDAALMHIKSALEKRKIRIPVPIQELRIQSEQTEAAQPFVTPQRQP
jgi:small conductance mechanosensitive channel